MSWRLILSARNGLIRNVAVKYFQILTHLDVSITNSGKSTSKETNSQSTNWLNIHIRSSTHGDTTWNLNISIIHVILSIKWCSSKIGCGYLPARVAFWICSIVIRRFGLVRIEVMKVATQAEQSAKYVLITATYLKVEFRIYQWSWYNSYHGLSLLEVVTWIQYRFKEVIVTYRKKCNLIWLCSIVLMKILNTAIFYWTRADAITVLMLTASK